MTRTARERRMENWTNSRIAVMESQTNIAVAYAGTKAATGVVWTRPSGPAVTSTKNVTRPSTTARASRFCAAPGDTVDRISCAFSGTAAVAFSIRATPARPDDTQQEERLERGRHNVG